MVEAGYGTVKAVAFSVAFAFSDAVAFSVSFAFSDAVAFAFVYTFSFSDAFFELRQHAHTVPSRVREPWRRHPQDGVQHAQAVCRRAGESRGAVCQRAGGPRRRLRRSSRDGVPDQAEQAGRNPAAEGGGPEKESANGRNQPGDPESQRLRPPARELQEKAQKADRRARENGRQRVQEFHAPSSAVSNAVRQATETYR